MRYISRRVILPKADFAMLISFSSYWKIGSISCLILKYYYDVNPTPIPFFHNQGFPDMTHGHWELHRVHRIHTLRTLCQAGCAAGALCALPAGLWHHCDRQPRDDPADQHGLPTPHAHVLFPEQSVFLWYLLLFHYLSQDAGWFLIWAKKDSI